MSLYRVDQSDDKKQLRLKRCAHCRVSDPRLDMVWNTGRRYERPDGRPGRYWAVFQCGSCGGLTIAKSHENSDDLQYIEEVYPTAPIADRDLPDRVRRYLDQAHDTLHAPDAAAMLAGSAVDAMLKARGYSQGSVYERIEKAARENVITEGMAKWAHLVRLGSNRPRHSDEDDPHVSPDEASAAVEFAKALGDFLFVLPARVERGIETSDE